MDPKYLKNASLLIKDSYKRNKNVKPKTKIPIYDNTSSILPSFTHLRDGWYNLIAGLGGSRAKATYTSYLNNFSLTDQLLYSLYSSNGISRRISGIIPDDAVKNGITIEGDPENLLTDKVEKLDVLSRINLADIYRRHFGGAIILLGIDDGGQLFDPIRLNTIKSIDWLRVYARTDIFFTNLHFTEDVNSPNYGLPEYYTIIPKYTTPFNVHYTRVIEFKGEEVPSYLDNGYRYYWGMSIIEPIWETLKKNGAGLENIDQLLYEVTLAIYRIKDLAKLMNEKRWDDIKTIIDTIDQSKSTIRSILQDAEDSFERDSINFAGVKDILDIFMSWLAGETGIPVGRLFGKQLGGLNNEGSYEVSIYNDTIKSWQKNKIQKQAQKIIDLIASSAEFKNKIQNPIVCYNSPIQLSENQELENKKLQSEIDEKYVNLGIITPDEVRELRFEEGWSYEMDVSNLENSGNLLASEEDENGE